jgi:hypothetical protein
MRAAAWLGTLALMAGGLSAQDRPKRSGLWGEIAPGVGHVRLACSGCPNVETNNGLTSNFRIGGTISKQVLIGFETFSLTNNPLEVKNPGESSAETGTLAIIMMWYPGKRGLFFKGGVGAAWGDFIFFQNGATQADTSEGAGMGLTFGMGWDWPISRKFAITANLGTYVTALGDVVLPGRRVDDLIATMYQLGVGFTFR